MKIKNISGSDREISPRGRLGWSPGDGLLVEAGAVIDLESDVAGRAPSAERIAAHEALKALDDSNDDNNDEVRRLVKAYHEADAGAGLLAQWEVWQPVGVKKSKANDEEVAA